jgi:hypothetical protein
MKTYSKENYTTYAEYAAELTLDLNNELNTFTFTRNEVEGQAVKLTVSDHSDDIFAAVKYPDKDCSISLKVSLQKNIIQLSAEIKEILVRYLETVKTSYKTFEDEIRANYLKQQEEVRRIREEQLEQAKFEKKKIKALEKLESLKPEKTSKLFNSPMTQYEALGWIAKHAKNIKASMPDYMEQWFVKQFGQDAERYVVDSTKKTSGGFDFQWSLGINITFDVPVSGVLEKRATSKNKKSINNVSFAWDLIENYGFVFGKKQDLNKILEEVPAQYLSDFRKGYAM